MPYVSMLRKVSPLIYKKPLFGISREIMLSSLEYLGAYIYFIQELFWV